MGARFALCAVIVWLAPRSAAAYLLDLNDARVVELGSFEAELQPIGYYTLAIGGEEHTLIAPSLQAVVGLARDCDLLLLTRGYARLDGAPGESTYALADQMLAFRVMLRHGAYSDEGSEGPSLTLQTGLLLPGIEADPDVGATLGLLFAQEGELGTLHANAWVNLTRDQTLEVFASAAIEGPPDWQVRPIVEVWIDLIAEGEPMASVVAGAWIDVTDDFAIEGGARVGGWEGWLDLEVRLAAWWRWQLWRTPEPLRERARAPRR